MDAAPAIQPQRSQPPALVRGLGLLDSVLLLVGGIIGSGIFLTSGQIADELRQPAAFLLVWVAGGAISLLACFAFAELGGMFPEAGGQYVYLREAYGNLPGFLYGWMMFTVGGSGTIAALAVGFAEYIGAAIPAAAAHRGVASVLGFELTRGHLVSMGAIGLLTAINVAGLRRGAVLQNVATWMKFAAIAVFVGLGFVAGRGDWSHYTSPSAMAPPTSMLSAFGVALIAVFWAYDGWVYITWVAGEVRQPQRTLPRAMVAAVMVVGAAYVAMNAVYLYALPMNAMAQQTTIAQTAAVALFSPAAARWMALMIAVSCFGAMSCAILSGSRIYYAMAHDGLFFRSLARVHPRWRTPALSLVVQGCWAAVLALSGRYDQLFTYVMFGMVLSYVAAVAGVFVLRRTRPGHPRPYRCTGYPYLPALYLLLSGAWALNAVWQRPKEALAGAVIVLLGVPGYVYWRRKQEPNSVVP